MQPPNTSSAADPASRRYLHAFDGLRLIAAFNVVLLHTFHADWLPPRLMRLVSWGSTSTSLLFVLSGFVLAYTYGRRDGTLRISRREFFWRRLSRVIPLVLLTHLMVVPLVWYVYPAGERLPRAIVTLSSLQAWFPAYATSFNSPGWSVSALLFWYLLFPPVLAAAARLGRQGLLAGIGLSWLAGAAAVLGFHAWAPPGNLYWLSVINHHPLLRLPEFLVGVLAARLLADGWQPSPRLLPLGLGGWLAGLFLLPDSAFQAAHNGLLSPFHAMMLLGIAGGGGALAGVLSWKPLTRLGDAGFAIFLLHVPIYALMVLPMAPFMARQPTAVRWGWYLLYLAVTLVSSVVVERAIASRATRWLRRGPTDARAARVEPAPTPTG